MSRRGLVGSRPPPVHHLAPAMHLDPPMSNAPLPIHTLTHPPLRPADATNWRSHAACLTHDPELFFPVGTAGPTLTQIEEAKQVCSECPVRTQCLQWAVEMEMKHGVWGGLTETERLSMKRRTARRRFLAAGPRVSSRARPQGGA